MCSEFLKIDSWKVFLCTLKWKNPSYGLSKRRNSDYKVGNGYIKQGIQSIVASFLIQRFGVNPIVPILLFTFNIFWRNVSQRAKYSIVCFTKDSSFLKRRFLGNMLILKKIFSTGWRQLKRKYYWWEIIK